MTEQITELAGDDMRSDIDLNSAELSTDVMDAIETASELDGAFPINFDDAWDWIGYKNKGSAKRALVNAGFIDGRDFQIINTSANNSGAGRKTEKITLTQECFKNFAMMARTERGCAVRTYYIKCEDRLKALMAERASRPLTTEELQSRLVLSIGTTTTWKKRFDDIYYKLLSRLTGLPLGENGQRPMLFASLTVEFVYNYMPKGVAIKLRECRKQMGGWRKLHQFLTPEGEDTFYKHMDKLITLMHAARDVNDLRRMMEQACAEAYQLKLIEDGRKDGVLTLSRQAKAG